MPLGPGCDMQQCGTYLPGQGYLLQRSQDLPTTVSNGGGVTKWGLSVPIDLAALN